MKSIYKKIELSSGAITKNCGSLWLRDCTYDYDHIFETDEISICKGCIEN